MGEREKGGLRKGDGICTLDGIELNSIEGYAFRLLRVATEPEASRWAMFLRSSMLTMWRSSPVL